MVRLSSRARRDAVSRDLADQTAQLAVFRDPSGRRWRRVRWIALIGLGLVVAAGLWVVPRLNAPVALDGRHPITITSAQTGLHPPVVGEGPLIRMAKVVTVGTRLEAVDPFTRAPVGVLPPADARKARRAIEAGKLPDVIQRFGYSATAKRTMSLTFDDGPDPTYTPKLLNLLAKYHVPATFFVTGKMAVKNPQLVRREVREGHAVGNHSLTHTDVSTASAWRTRDEMVITDHVLRAITGHYSSYFRLPYEGDDEASIQATLNGLLRAQRWGYLVVSHDFDTEDWQYALHPHGPQIPMPPLDGRNLTVLMHDGEGSGRQSTIDYVAKLIPAAMKAGYVFQTMPQVQPLTQAASGKVKPSVWDRIDLILVEAAYVWPIAALRATFLYAIVAVVGIGFINACLALGRRHRVRRPRPPVCNR